MALVADTYPVMTLGEAQAIRASWPMGSNQQRTQADAILTAHADHTKGLQLDPGRHNAKKGSAWSTWYSSYEAVQ